MVASKWLQTISLIACSQTIMNLVTAYQLKPDLLHRLLCMKREELEAPIKPLRFRFRTSGQVNCASRLETSNLR